MHLELFSKTKIHCTLEMTGSCSFHAFGVLSVIGSAAVFRKQKTTSFFVQHQRLDIPLHGSQDCMLPLNF